MIGINSMTDQNQEIDLSLKRLENISIVGKESLKKVLLAFEIRTD